MPGPVIDAMLERLVLAARKEIDSLAIPGNRHRVERKGTAQGFPGVPGPIIVPAPECVSGVAHKEIQEPRPEGDHAGPALCSIAQDLGWPVGLGCGRAGWLHIRCPQPPL